MTTTTEDARKTLAQLEQGLIDATKSATKLQEERRRLAYDANTGDKAARKALDSANAASATAALEIDNVRAAIDEARRRLAEAERFEAMAAQRENAAAANVIAERIAERGKRIDAAFSTVREEIEALEADINALHKLGLANPRGEQFKVLGGLALTTALLGLPLKAERDHLAPRERHNFTDLATGWSTQIARWADGIVGDKSEAA